MESGSGVPPLVDRRPVSTQTRIAGSMSTLTATEDPWSKVETTTGLSTSGAVVKDAAGIMTKRVAYGYDVFDRRVTKDVDANRDGLDETGERFV